MTGTAERLPMDVAEDSQLQQEQQQQRQQEGEDHKKDSVRARLINISQVAPEGEVVPLDILQKSGSSTEEGISPPARSPPSDEDEYRRKLVSISYVDVPMAAQ